ncbi:alpha/beta-hydrolase N-terminal domain-containing protein [Rhodococcus ruber]|uniref:alpha/beta-hydrolase N-terminal domain-containing protein n=1 Tax=Rhodococcus ruber TaxID=1830 RepID=UPI001F45C312|nr:alpha/beta-hydrolase N-terminal domain-containing protein [Rhodococcus ruber]
MVRPDTTGRRQAQPAPPLRLRPRRRPVLLRVEPEPSLIPHEWYFLGPISGLTGIVGCGVGVLVPLTARRWIASRLTWWRQRHTVRRTAEVWLSSLRFPSDRATSRRCRLRLRHRLRHRRRRRRGRA